MARRGLLAKGRQAGLRYMSCGVGCGTPGCLSATSWGGNQKSLNFLNLEFVLIFIGKLLDLTDH